MQEVEEVVYFTILSTEKCATSKCINQLLLPSIYLISKSQKK